ERRLEQVARADGDAQGEDALAGAARRVLVDGEAGVDATALQEQAADGRARALGGDEDNVDVGRRDDAGLLAVDDAEAVREVEGLAFRQVRLERRPVFLLSGVGKQVLDDGALRGGLFEWEERLARLPAVLHRLVPRTRAGPLADDHVDAVV